MEKLLSLVRKSIAHGYLPENWHETKDEVIETYTGYLSLSSNCVEIESEYYHEEKDIDLYVYDGEYLRYILLEDSIRVYTSRHEFFCTTALDDHRYFEYRDTYYTDGGLADHGLVVVSNGDIARRDEVYYWESDDEFHYEEEEEDGEIWEYHTGPCPPDYRHDTTSPGIGFEIEKGGSPEFCGYYDKVDLFDSTGCVIEKDGSVEWELKTPVYPLYSADVENIWLPQIIDAINAENHENAGGHIHLSLPSKSGRQLFDYCRPYLPLFMAMYPNRLQTDYCKGKPESSLKTDGEKYQAIKLWENRIELRFPAKVYNIGALTFRLDFCRLMIKREYKNIVAATLAAFDRETSLNQLVMIHYKGRESILLDRIITISQKYFNTDLLREKSIETLLKTIKIQKLCVSQS
ncbi:MAG TPA: hypothetical protein VN040_14825 [Pseudosphingobacterium sp.]|nr:hypothetical protein [Pseudosphingobacterium sp.]